VRGCLHTHEPDGVVHIEVGFDGLPQADDRLMREQIAKRSGVTAKRLMPMLSVPVVEVFFA